MLKTEELKLVSEWDKTWVNHFFRGIDVTTL